MSGYGVNTFAVKMPNKRAQGKAQVNSWVPEELKARLAALARLRGIPLSQLVEEILIAEADQVAEEPAKPATSKNHEKSHHRKN